jgi:hypothetical protein
MDRYERHDHRHDDVTAEHDAEARFERDLRWQAERAYAVLASICPDCHRWGWHEPWCPALSLRKVG